jgi:hypothetical protein
MLGSLRCGVCNAILSQLICETEREKFGGFRVKGEA